MYNRYIPQSDGSYRKNKLPESAKTQHPNSGSKSNGPTGGFQNQGNPPQPPSVPDRRPNNPPRHQSAEGFLRQLLPQGLDTGDLLIGVLLLLMAGDCQEDKNTALLTLALYLFM